VRFILDHYEIANNMLADNRDKIELPNEICGIVRLLEKNVLTVHELEPDDASIARVWPAVNDRVTFVEESATRVESIRRKGSPKNVRRSFGNESCLQHIISFNEHLF
jgi:hypothetical protein